jgi:hypothetical protein
MSIQTNFPAIKPTLLLDFANVEQLDPRITFTRASTATYYGTQTAKAEQNLLLQSQTFGTTWTSTGSTVSSNSVAAPDGTTTADTLTESATTSGHILGQAPSITSGLTYSASVFGKNVDGQYMFVTFRGAASNYVYALFDLLNGVVTTSSATGTGYSVTSTAIQDVGNGWYRCSVVGVVGTTVSSPNVYVGLSDASAPTTSGFPSYTGTSKSIYIWGAQLEARSTVTAYTPTTTQPITNYIPQLLTAASGVARFDHNPTTFESLGLLIEEQRTNTTNYSEQFNDAWWNKTRATATADVIVSPDGTLDADKLVEDTTASNTHYLRSTNYSTVSGTSYTWSIFLKAGERTKARVSLQLFSTGSAYGPANPRVDIDLLTGVLSNSAGTIATSVFNAGNGWYRVSVSGTATATQSDQAAGVFLLDGAGNQSYTGDGYSGIFIWGAQLEVGAFPTSYIRTVASQVTRSADVAVMTGTNFSSWYNQQQGSIYWDGSGVNAFGRNMLSISDNTVNNRIRMVWTTSNATSISTEITTGNVFQGSVPSGVGSIVSGQQYKLGFAYATNDLAGSRDGGAAGTDTSALIPVVDRMYIGAGPTGGFEFFNGHIRKVSYYPLRVTNAQLQALTS